MPENSKNCPNCLSNNLLEIKPHEFECKSCAHQFTFNKPSESITTRDVKGHYCPFCGKSTSGGLGHKCLGCDRVDFCNNCVHRSPDKLFCNECLISKKKNCLECNTFAEYSCRSCKNISKKIQKEDYRIMRSCKAHQHVFYSQTYVDKYGSLVAILYNCPKCGGVCPNCTIKVSKFLSSKLVCKFCNSKLKQIERDVR